MTPYQSFCHRMWLDYCDEHKQPLGGEALLSYEEYIVQYRNYLEERYVARISNCLLYTSPSPRD